MRFKPETDTAVFKIKNVSGGSYAVEELGGYILADDAELNLMDAALPVHYESYEAVIELITRCSESQLYQDIQAGIVVVVESTPPTLNLFSMPG